MSISPYPLIPANYGGPKRIGSLNRVLAQYFVVEQFCISFRRPLHKQTDDGVLAVHHIFRPLISLIGLPFAALRLSYRFLFSYRILLGSMPRDLSRALDIADVVVVHQPDLFGWVFSKYPNQRYLLDQHNVEYKLELSNRGNVNGRIRRLILRRVRLMESYALSNADMVTVVSEMDKNDMHELYGTSLEKLHVVPNGFDDILLDARDVSRTIPHDLLQVIGTRRIIVFIGSPHEPNREALKIIRDVIAPDVMEEDAVFLVLGAAGDKNMNVEMSNVYCTGVVDDIEPYLRVSCIAINPMVSGGGTNIKMLEFLGSGLATISTPFGARGLGLSEREFVSSAIEDFGNNIRTLLKDDARRTALGANAQGFVREHFTWTSSAEKMRSVIERLAQR